ncbi:MAG: hypothetical protein MRJ93_01005 [Nitrososphaeraceae archaeon]|nr:hypothetical protein [Nitrososphaeraceae archaeon]
MKTSRKHERHAKVDILIIAQSQAHANEHLRTLKNLILNIEKYRHFLITKPSELLLPEEKTKELHLSRFQVIN